MLLRCINSLGYAHPKRLLVFALGLVGVLAIFLGLSSVSLVVKGAGPQGPNWNLPSERLSLFSNGYFPALHGYFFVDGEKLHVYRALPMALNSQTGKWEPSPENDELKSLWKGEPYYHEIYELNHGEWVPKIRAKDSRGKREFSQMPAQYLKFTDCDRNDALALRNNSIQNALWRGTKQKDSVEIDDYVAVLFSADPATLTGPTPSPYNAEQRPLQLALLKRGTAGWEFPAQAPIVSTGNYCGKKILSASRGEKLRTILLLFFEEGDYAVAYSYVAD